MDLRILIGSKVIYDDVAKTIYDKAYNIEVQDEIILE